MSFIFHHEQKIEENKEESGDTVSVNADTVSDVRLHKICENHEVPVKYKILASTLSLLFILSTGAPTFANVSTITVKDFPVPRYGIETKLTGKPRIVALANGSMEVLYALGVERYVVGRDIGSNFQAVTRIPVVTNGHAISAEKLLKLKPTIILVDKNSGPAKALEVIKKSGVKVVVIPEAYSIPMMTSKYQAIIKGINLKEKSAPAEKLLASIPPVKVETASSNLRVAFFYLRGSSSIYLMGGKGSGADGIIQAAGGMDVGAEMGLPAFAPITSEAVLTADPAILLVMKKGVKSVGGVEGLQKLPGIAQLVKERKRKVISVDDSLLLSFGPRTSELIEKLREILESASVNT